MNLKIRNCNLEYIHYFFIFYPIQVNASPSLTADTPMDYHLKYVLLNDMFDVVDLENKKKGKGSNIIG